MSEEQYERMEEFLAVYRYILVRVEFLEAALAWLCIHDGMSLHDSSNDIQLAHSSLYSGQWVENPPPEESWPVQIYMSKGGQA